MKLTLKFFKNNQVYDLSYPTLLNQNYNERIDDFKCKIVHLANKIDIKLKDLVLIHDIDNKLDDLYMIVCSYSITQDSLDNTTYSYDLQLCSETKDLEGYICPQMSITPLKVNPRSIYWYLNKFNEEYGAKIRVKNNLNVVSWITKWTYSQRVINKFSSITAPELQWNTPTFKEVLTDLMMVKDCIPIVRNNVIDYIDLTQTSDALTHYNYLAWSNDLSNYASDLQMNMQNVMQTKTTGINDTTKSVEYIPFNSSEYTMTSNNIILKTRYPILKINKLEMITFSDYKEFQDTFYQNAKSYVRDFTNIDGYSLICESQEYQTKDVLYIAGAFDPSKTGAYYSQYQNYCAYYTRGSNEINGFNNLSKKYVILSGELSTLQWWSMINAKQKRYERLGTGISQGNYSPNFRQYFFKIEYETTTNQILKTSKDEVVNQHTIIDNQTNAWVDAFTQGNLEKQKANRIGNETIMFNQRWETGNLWNYAKIGDYWLDDNGDKNIIYQVQYQIFQDHIDINGYMCKNYVLKNTFTSVDSKIRTWKNATNEAFEKQMLKRYFCSFSKEQHTETSINNNIARYLVSPLYDTSISPLKYMVIQTIDNNNTTYPASDKLFVVDLINRQIGNSLVFTGGFENNTFLDKKIVADDNEINIQDENFFDWDRFFIDVDNDVLVSDTGVKMKAIKYVDDNFEEEETLITLSDNIPRTDIEITDNTVIDINDMLTFTRDVLKYPVINEERVTSPIIEEYFNNHKDNKEIPSFTMQYEFTTDTPDIYFTKYWLFQQKAIRTITGNMPTVRFIDYSFNNETREGTDSNWTITATRINNGVVAITLNGNGEMATLTNKAISIGYGNQNWIVVNPKITGQISSYTFYMNILNDKNRTIYDSSDHKVKVGEI